MKTFTLTLFTLITWASATAQIDHSSFNSLLSKYVSKKGEVNYVEIKNNNTELNAYLDLLANTHPNNNWSKNEKLAFWMNAYNAFTVKLIVDHYPLKSIKDIKTPWDLEIFSVGNKKYSLNHIEHKILRKMNEPRIHFGINCASFSCPPLYNKAFTATNVEATLETLAVNFINDPQRNTIQAEKIALSKIFQWFAKDFKTNGSLIDFINQYASTPVKKNAKKSYLKYNWNLNE